MRVSLFLKPLSVSSLLLLFLAAAFAEVDSSGQAAKILPDKIGDFRAIGAARSFSYAPGNETKEFGALSTALREYVSANGGFQARLIKARSDSAAYAFLSDAEKQMRKSQPSQVSNPGDIGTLAYAVPGRLAFFKGAVFAVIDREDGKAWNDVEASAFARLLAETLDGGDGEIPVLVKHLPDWETAKERSVYALSPVALQEAVGQQPVLDAINFEGGTEAVTASYDSSQLVIVEYTTPQLATDADAQINARLKELHDGGQPVPSAYRRVGNYAVFVFGAPDEETATNLISRVNYEQVVQWLGTNPNALARAQRRYTETTAGIILAVLKASGLSVILCLAIGGLFGALVFRRRRAKQAVTEAYSDAGGIVRLNLDEMTPQSDPARLLAGKGDR